MPTSERRHDADEIKRKARELIELPIVEMKTSDGTLVKPISSGHLSGAARALEIAHRIEDALPAEPPAADFPASPDTRGQPESRTAHAALHAQGDRWPWWSDYLAIRQQFAHFRNWRIYVYLAWASQPAVNRQPATEGELAEQVLGCTTRAIRNWKAKDWGDAGGIDQAIAFLQAAPLLQHRRDIFDALVEVARTPDPRAHQDRKLALEMTGDYTPRQNMEQDIGPNVQDWLAALRGDGGKE